MTTNATRIGLRELRIGRFESIQEAIAVLGPDMVLDAINAMWHNLQVLKYQDALTKRNN